MKDLRRELGAGATDVIDHLMIDAPPCAPDEEDREVTTSPISPAALTLKRMLELFDGSLSFDFSERNVAAILELGGRLELQRHGAASAVLAATFQPEGSVWDRVLAFAWSVYYVESRADAEINARSYPAQYAGWNEPPPPEKSAEQLDADRRQAEFEAAEAAMVAAAARELAIKGAA